MASNWLKLNHILRIENEKVKSILSQPIFLNSDVKYKGNVLFMPQMIKNNIKYVYDLFQDNHLRNIENVKRNIITNYPGLTLDFNAIINSIPKAWRTQLQTSMSHGILQSTMRDNSETPVLIPEILKTDNNKIRKIINDARNATICSKNLWQRKYDIDITKNFSIAKQTTPETRLNVLHFKILHNIYPTNILLHKMKIKENNLCETCLVTDYLEHFFVECSLVKDFWESMKSLMLRDINKSVSLNLESIMFGINKTNNREYTNREIKYINFVILVGKMCISKAKYGKVKNISMIFEHEWHLRKRTVNPI